MWWTYYGDFATKLILDLAFLDRIWSVLIDELVEVLNTHCDRVSRTVLLSVVVS